MAINFPRDMPPSGPSVQEFEPQRVDYSAPEASGRLGGIQAGAPLWMATWALGKLSVAQSDEWRAWIASLRGSQRAFYGCDQGRPYPRAYMGGFTGMTRAGGGSFNGAASAWSETIDGADNSVIGLSGLPASFVFSRGDYIGFKWDAADAPAGSYGRRALVRAVEAAAGSAGGVLTVTCEPPVPMVVPSGAIAYLNRPTCIMKLMQGSAAGSIDRSHKVSGGKIVALQDLMP